MHRNAVAVTEAARSHGLEIEVREFPAGTRTAADAASAIGVVVAQIVKSLVFAVGDDPTTDGETVLAFVSGSNQLDETMLALAAERPFAWRVDADTVRAATGFPVGGVPPFGHATAMRRFADLDLLRFDVVWAAAGTPHHVFALSPADLLRATQALPVRLALRTDS